MKKLMLVLGLFLMSSVGMSGGIGPEVFLNVGSYAGFSPSPEFEVGAGLLTYDGEIGRNFIPLVGAGLCYRDNNDYNGLAPYMNVSYFKFSRADMKHKRDYKKDYTEYSMSVGVIFILKTGLQVRKYAPEDNFSREVSKRPTIGIGFGF